MTNNNTASFSCLNYSESLRYKTIPVALSAWLPKFRLLNKVFLAINDFPTRCAPSTDPWTAFRHEASMTNLVTSSYNQLSHTPSDATTIQSTSGSEVFVCDLKIASRSIVCTSGRCDTPLIEKGTWYRTINNTYYILEFIIKKRYVPYVCKWRSPNDLVNANASWYCAVFGVATKDALHCIN